MTTMTTMTTMMSSLKKTTKTGDIVDAIKQFLAEHRELPGIITHAAAFAARLHNTGTAIAEDNGVDLGSVTSVGGVMLGGFHAEGGGGR